MRAFSNGERIMKPRDGEVTMAKTFVLVHGFSHGAWAWDALRERLARRGHTVLAVDLPGHGRRAAERARASLDAYAQAVADAMMLAGASRAVVVGHSMAGMVIPHVATLVPARVAHLVFLAAVVPVSGASMLATHIAPAWQPLLEGLARAGDGAIQYPAAFEWARWLGDMPPGDARVVDALARLTPQPLRPVTEPVDLRRFHALGVPRTYIRCLRDTAVPPARAAEYAARLGVAPIDLDTAHNPMVSAPDTLARILDRL
jgi:pimeloyl-ACP methyl ester carboxylesterase